MNGKISRKQFSEVSGCIVSLMSSQIRILLLKEVKHCFVGVRKYSPVICDIFYDHFLAAAWSAYSTVDMDDYSKNVSCHAASV
ncbi:MAG: hypothetical protein R2847_06720 [Bacteroidia bacterium]